MKPISPSYHLQPLPRIPPDRVVAEYEGLTFPPVERRFALRSPAPDLVGASVLGPEGVVGLGLAEPCEDGRARLVSLLVLPAHRGCGLGALLLEETERQLAMAGAREIEGSYRTSWRSRERIERMLESGGWSPPRTRFLIGRGETTRSLPLSGRLPSRESHPEGVEIFTWGDLPPEERDDLLERQRSEEVGFPDALTPFQEEGRLDPMISVGLRWQGEVAGWLIVHRVGPDTVQYTSLWIRPDARRRGFGRFLVGEALRRRLADPRIRYGIFVIQPGNEPMKRFVETQLVPHLTTWSEQRVSRKRLIGPTGPG